MLAPVGRRVAIAVLGIAVAAGALWLRPDPPPAGQPPLAPSEPPVAAPDPAAWAGLELALRESERISERDLPNTYERTAIRQRLYAALKGPGPPKDADLGAWRPYAPALAEVETVLAQPGLSLPHGPDFYDNAHLLWQATALGEAMALRGWDKVETGQPAAGASAMLLGFALGVRMVDAAEDGWPVRIGDSVQEVTLRELGKLADNTRDPGTLRALLAGLRGLHARPGATVRVLNTDCLERDNFTRTDLSKRGQLLVESGIQLPDVGWPTDVVNTALVLTSYDPEETTAALQAHCAFMRPYLNQRPARPPADWDVTLPDFWRSASRLQMPFSNPVGKDNVQAFNQPLLFDALETEA